VGFFGGKVLITRADGAKVAAWVASHPAMLHELVRRNEWGKAARLCRFVAHGSLWAAFAALAMSAGELDAAEAAFAAIGAADKLAFARRCAAMVPAERRAAELALYRRQPGEAEALLLQAGLVYRAIKLHVRMHNWVRALEVAQKHQQHVNTVLLYRRRHLQRTGQQQDTLEAFRRAAEVVGAVDEAAVRQQIADDKQRERDLKGGGCFLQQKGFGGVVMTR